MIAAVGDRDGEVAKDDAGVVGGAALAGRRHRRGEAEPVGQLDQEVGAGVEDEPLAVALTSTVWRVVCVFTFQVSSWVVANGSANRILKSQEDALGRPSQVPISALLLLFGLEVFVLYGDVP